MPTIGVAGVGLIGGSVALRALSRGWDVAIFEPDPAHLETARDRLGAVVVARDLADLAARCDTLVLAAPLEATLAHLAALAEHGTGAARLTLDVASVKGAVARAGASIPTFCATHPIAGSERSGPQAARADLFEGRVWSYDVGVAPDVRAGVLAFIAAMGASAVAIASDEHDRVVALTSHLPQMLAVGLGSHLASRADVDSAVFDFCGTGIRSMLRLAGSSWTVWRAVLDANAVPLAQEVRELANVLSEIAVALETGSDVELGAYFSRAGSVVDRLNANVSGPSRVTPADGSVRKVGL